MDSEAQFEPALWLLACLLLVCCPIWLSGPQLVLIDAYCWLAWLFVVVVAISFCHWMLDCPSDAVVRQQVRRAVGSAGRSLAHAVTALLLASFCFFNSSHLSQIYESGDVVMEDFAAVVPALVLPALTIVVTPHCILPQM